MKSDPYLEQFHFWGIFGHLQDGDSKFFFSLLDSKFFPSPLFTKILLLANLILMQVLDFNFEDFLKNWTGLIIRDGFDNFNSFFQLLGRDSK